MEFVIIALIALIIATITDLKKREVPDLLNFSLMAFAIVARLIQTIIQKDVSILVWSFIGFCFAAAISLILYYTGQWGGGDAKMLMALGVLFGYESVANPFTFPDQITTMGIFMLHLFIIGALYGLVWLFILAIFHWRKIKKDFFLLCKKTAYIRYVIYILTIVSMILYYRSSFARVSLVFLLTMLVVYFLQLIVKSTEKNVLIRSFPVSKLTEGEWIFENVYHQNKLICGPKDLGVTNEQIALLKKYNIKTVLVKVGIPFIPAFLLAFILTITLPSPIFFILGL